MTPHRIVTPFFIGREEPRLAQAVGPAWHVNAPDLPDALPLARMARLYDRLADSVADEVRSGQQPVSISGDCLSALGVTAGLQRAGVAAALLWFDAHGDFNTYETSPSGFLGGMPLAMLVGRGDQALVEGLRLRPLDEASVLLTDARDLDPGEREAVAASRLRHLPRVESLLSEDLPAGPLHVHFDTDVVDPAESPGQNYLAPGGPSAALLAAVFERIARTGRIVAVSVSAWAPDKDADGRSRRVSLELVDCLAPGGAR
jgi:arginase